MTKTKKENKVRLIAGLLSLIFVSGCEGAVRAEDNDISDSSEYTYFQAEDFTEDQETSFEIKSQQKGFDGRHRENLIQEENHVEDRDIEAFNTLYVDINFTEFELVYGAQFAIEIYNYKSQTMDAPVVYSVSDGKLTIEQEDNRIIGVSGINYVSGKNCMQQRVIVTMPEGHKLGDVSIKGYSNVTVSGLTADYLYTDVSYGRFTGDGCKIKNADIQLSYVEGSLNNFEADTCNLTIMFSQLELYNDVIGYYEEVKIASTYSDVILNGYNTPDISLEVEYSNAKVIGSIFDACSLDMSFSDVEIEETYAKEFTCIGMYGGLEMAKWESDTMSITSQYTNVAIGGDIKGTNIFNTSFGDLKLNVKRPVKNYMMDIKMLFGDIAVDGESKGSAYKKLDSAVEYSILASGSYSDVTVDFTQ